jgi:phosphopantothenoylcysteine decarboxylase/phosphopantothenate--cysteine ligase
MQFDLNVDLISPSLMGKNLDFIVTGSIAACESPRLIRALRRLGANVRVTLTDGGGMFITKTSLEWASAQSITTDFSGLSTHLATSDAIVIAPMTADFLAKIKNGICNDPASALVQSALGQKKLVLAIPTMHDSLWKSPFVEANYAVAKQWITFLQPRLEEGKLKFPDPEESADRISHAINRSQIDVLLTMGPTKGYIDDVRYISNYSSGALGTAINNELFRQGCSLYCISGPSQIKPRVFTELVNVETNLEMDLAIARTLAKVSAHVVMAAAVLDYVPAHRVQGKIRSGSPTETLELKSTEKLLSKIKPNGNKRIAFKLEPDGTNLELKAKEYLKKYSLDYVFTNTIHSVNQNSHKATLYSENPGSSIFESKSEIALKIAQILCGV